MVLGIPFCLKSTNATFWTFRIKSNVSVVSAGLRDLVRLLCQPRGGPLSPCSAPSSLSFPLFLKHTKLCSHLSAFADNVLSVWGAPSRAPDLSLHATFAQKTSSPGWQKGSFSFLFQLVSFIALVIICNHFILDSQLP